jgi:hypothetical protein
MLNFFIFYQSSPPRTKHSHFLWLNKYGVLCINLAFCSIALQTDVQTIYLEGKQIHFLQSILREYAHILMKCEYFGDIFSFFWYSFGYKAKLYVCMCLYKIVKFELGHFHSHRAF